jgi:hypothetical protein
MPPAVHKIRIERKAAPAQPLAFSENSFSKRNLAMLAEFVARHAAARNIHYGWVMAALGFLYSLFASSALGVPSVLMREIAADAHVSMGELSASQGLRFALFGLVAPFAGGLMLRYGPRMMLSIAGTMALLRHNEALLAPYPGASASDKTAAE